MENLVSWEFCNPYLSFFLSLGLLGRFNGFSSSTRKREETLCWSEGHVCRASGILFSRLCIPTCGFASHDLTRLVWARQGADRQPTSIFHMSLPTNPNLFLWHAHLQAVPNLAFSSEVTSVHRILIDSVLKCSAVWPRSRTRFSSVNFPSALVNVWKLSTSTGQTPAPASHHLVHLLMCQAVILHAVMARNNHKFNLVQ